MNNKPVQQPWWNRPLWGEDNLFHSADDKIDKKLIPDLAITHHKEVWDILRFTLSVAKSLDDVIFREPEFQNFIQIKSAFVEGVSDYRDLNHSIILLRIAIELKDSFFKIEDTEMCYRSKAQQDFYQEIFDLLDKKVSQLEFKERVRHKLNKVLSEIKTEEGKEALKGYVQSLDFLARQNELALKLFYLFKKYNFYSFSILRTISEMVVELHNKNIQDLNSLAMLVKNNYEMFEKLGKIIELPAQKRQIQSYAIMLQYLVLRQKYQETYVQFQRLIELLIDWHTAYKTLLHIRQQYPNTEYQVSEELTREIPGLTLYNKYQQYLTYFLPRKNLN